MFQNKGSLSGNLPECLKPPIDGTAGFTTIALNLKDYNHATIKIQQGASSGSATLTLLAKKNATPSGGTPMAFKYRQCTNGAGASDTWGAEIDATNAGITLSTAYVCTLIELNAVNLEAALAGATYFYLVLTAPSAAFLIEISAVLTEPRIASYIPQTAIV